VIVNTLVKDWLEKDVAGASNVTLTEAEARYSQIECSGTITANIDVIVPAEAKTYIIRNTTTATGGETLTVKTTGATGVAVTNGSAFHLGCDATEVYRIS
jgi:urease alpha subunit